MNWIVAILVASLMCSFITQAQDYPRKNIDQSRLADELFGFQDTDLNYEELYENMVQLLSNPININKSTAESLRFLNILSGSQIQSLIKYRNENGNLLSVYELQAIPEFDLTTIYKLLPFVQVIDPNNFINSSILKRSLHNDNNYLLMRYERTFEPKAGFASDLNDQKKFKGSPDKLYMRFRSSKPGDFSFGFTAEKDAGEELIWKNSTQQYGFDFLSGHAQIQNKGKLKNLIIGDYQNQFAQGIMLGGMFGMGKGAETITTTRRSNIGSLPYTSINEFGLLRGAAATYEIVNNIYLSGFYSRIRRDATSSNSQDEAAGISVFQMTGLHRNGTELQNRQQVLENNNGLVLQYNHKNIDAGVLFNNISFNKPVDTKLFVYNQFDFHGTRNQNMGAYINYNFNNTLFFSEISKSAGGGIGGIAGIMGSLTNQLDISILYRKFDRNFYSFYSNAFSEGTKPQNESGIYWGCKYKWNRKFSFAGYMDFFRFPWLRFRSYAPSEGYEWLARLSYQPSKQVLIFVQTRAEIKNRNIDTDPTVYHIAEGVKKNYWVNCAYGLGQKLKMKTRAQFSTYTIDQKTTKGMALMQDISIDFGKLELTSRHALFDTDDYDNRQYSYEQDVWLAYSLPAYYGKGIRNFVLLEYTVNKVITIWLRYSRTRYTNQEEIGSGMDKIAGSIRNDIKFQLRLKL